jgi:hypothetical protein
MSNNNENNRKDNQTNQSAQEDPVRMGMWLKIYEEAEQVVGNLLFNEDEEYYLDVTIPDEYDDELPEFEPIPDHEKQSLEQVNTYFEEILDGDYRISNINGKETNDVWGIGSSKMICSYCDYTDSYNMHHCTECDKVMCDLCYGERTVEDALKNGSKRWLERKDALLTCFAHEAEGKFDRKEVELVEVRCDVCSKNSMEKMGEWFMNRQDDLDLCVECSTTPKGKEILKNSNGNWKMKSLSKDDHPALNTGYGSFLNWVPVMVSSEEGHMMMYNIVPGNEHYHKVALVACDDHGRMGFHVINKSLDEMLEELQDLYQKYLLVKEEKGCSWDTHYSSPISQALQDRDIEVYYG